MIIQIERIPEFSFHFYMTPVGWSLVAMGQDGLYVPNAAMASWVRDLAANLRNHGFARYRPVWHISKLSNRSAVIMWEPDLDMPPDAAERVVSAIRAIDCEHILGLEASLGGTVCLESILSGSLTNLSSPGVYSNLAYQPGRSSTRATASLLVQSNKDG